MSSVSIILGQYFAGAAGFQLSSDGVMTRGDETLLEIAVQNGRISAQSHYDVLGIVAEAVSDRAELSVRYAKSIDLDKLGTLALACKAAPDVGGVLQRLARYQTLLSESVLYHLDRVDDATFLRQDVLVGFGPGLVFSPEAGLSAMYQAVLQVAARPVCPLKVTFGHKAPGDAHLFEEFFGCAVEFEAKADGILLSNDSLKTPNKLGDQALSEFLTKHLDAELEQLQTAPSLVRTTKEEMRASQGEKYDYIVVGSDVDGIFNPVCEALLV